MTWAGGDDRRQICWLYGPAGFGKSAVAQTVAERCASENILAASFFFKRGAGGRARIAGFVSTLSYQLTFSIPELKSPIEIVLRSDPTIPYQSLDRQFRKLIINPVIAHNTPIRRMVIVIDALDECDDKDEIAEFIEILIDASRECRLPFLFFITARAENHIVAKFSPPESVSVTYSLGLHDFDAHADVRSFLLFRFSKFLSETPRLMRGVQRPWPSEEDMNCLVEKSSGIFIFASTLVDFVTDQRAAPRRRLQMVLQTHTGLDPLYAEVFDAAYRDGSFDRVIGSIIILREQLSIIDLGSLLHLASEDVLHVVLQIQSILRIPEDDAQPVELIHASLRDFLMEERRSERFFIDPPARHASMLVDCLGLMTTDAQKQNPAMDRAVLYASRNWCHHLDVTLMENGGNSLLVADLTKCLQDFKAAALGHWINIMIRVQGANDTVNTLQKIIKVCSD